MKSKLRDELGKAIWEGIPGGKNRGTWDKFCKSHPEDAETFRALGEQIYDRGRSSTTAFGWDP